MITKKQTYTDDRKVQQQPNYGVKKWMAEVVIGYTKLKSNPRLKLKKYTSGNLEIYDNDKLLGSYSAVGNIYWGEQSTAGTDVFQNFKNLKNNPEAKGVMEKIDESFFDVEEIDDNAEVDQNALFTAARGKMASRIVDYYNTYASTRKTPAIYKDGAMKEITSEELKQHILRDYPDQFNKYGLKLAEWILDGVISDKQAVKKRRFIAALNELYKTDNAKYDEKLNGLSPDDIIEEYAAAVKASIRKERELIDNIPVEDKGYTVVRIKDYKHAQSYEKYFKGTPDTWCVTASNGGERMFDSYIDPLAGKNEVFYVLLAKDFEKIRRPIAPSSIRENDYEKYIHPETGEIYPATLDGEYAKSMIMVGVRQDGSIRQSTSRLNHSLGGNAHGDLSYTAYDLSRIIGRSIYKVCPPLSNPLDLLRDIKVKGIPYINTKTDSGKKTAFYYGEAFYIVENGKLMLDSWGTILRFDSIILVKEKPGDSNSPTIGYIFIQKLLNEDTLMDDNTDDFFVGMNLNLDIVYGPTKKGDIISAIKETRKVIQGVK